MSLERATVLGVPERAVREPGRLEALAAAIAGLVESGKSLLVVVGPTGLLPTDPADGASAAAWQEGDGLAAVRGAERERWAARLGHALAAHGIASRRLGPTAWPSTRGSTLEAEPRSLPSREYADAFDRARVVIVSGAVGRSEDGSATSLGSGGYELSAVFTAERLGLPVWLIRESRRDATLPRRAQLFARRHHVPVTWLPLAEAATAAEVGVRARGSVLPLSA